MLSKKEGIFKVLSNELLLLIDYSSSKDKKSKNQGKKKEIECFYNSSFNLISMLKFLLHFIFRQTLLEESSTRFSFKSKI